ncbi:Vigilin [Dactylellina cionopaga]|nr:Vigilin [Dactylellina cionopaga]
MATESTNGLNGSGSGNTVPEVAIDAPTTESASSSAANESAAAKMAKLHAQAATVEEVLDEEDLLHPGSKSAIATGQATPIIDGPLPQSSQKKQQQIFDINSQDLFPELGSGGSGKGKGKNTGPAAPPTWGAKMNGSSAIVGNVASAAQQAPKATLPLLTAEITEVMNIDKSDQIPRDQLKKPVAEILRSIMKETGARIQASSSSTGMLTFITKGKPDAVLKAKTSLRRELCRKTQDKMSIPVRTRKHIIGPKGATIQGITQRTGCRVQIPQVEEAEEAVDDPFAEEEPMVEIALEGDADGIKMARHEIQQIVGQKTSHVNVKLPFDKFPGQFFPFLAGPHNTNITQMEEGKDLKIRIPIYHTSESSKEFSEPPVPIMLSGERSAVQEARTLLEKHAAQLRDEFQSISINIPKPQHRFLTGDRGKTIGDILLESGCSVVVPPAHIQFNSVLVIGPRDKIGNGVTSVMNKANSMTYDSIDISRAHGPALDKDVTLQRQHARDLARYFRKIREIQRIENEFDVQILLPKTDILYDINSGVTFEITGKDKENVKKAKEDVIKIVNAHPPTRLHYTDIEPLLHRHIIGAKGRNLQKIKDDHGVEVLFADEDDQDSQVVLIFEGPSGTQTVPDAAVAAAALLTVTELLQKTASEQADLKTKVLNIPAKYHAKIVGPKGTTLNAFTGGSDAIVKVTVGAPKLKPGAPALSPAQAIAADDSITIRGPSAEVERVAKKITDFVEDTKHNEVLNSYTVTFDFPQKFQKNLVGKGGSNISKYREELGVQIDIDKNNDNVTIKGIKANVDEAKIQIQKLGKKLEDETTSSIIVAPEYHRTIIGQGGKFVRRLEDKYFVRIQFPKAARDDSSDMASDAGAGAAPARAQAPNEIVLRGPSKGVKDAKDEIDELIKYERDHGHSAAISIPAKVLPHIIGAGGKVINQIRDDSGAKIDLPPHGSTEAEMVEVKLRGTKDQVAKAKTAILAAAKDMESLVVKMLNVDKKFHRALIGPGGQTLHAIVVKCGGPADKSAQARMVRFPHHDVTDNNIKVEGNLDVVDKIIKELEAIIDAEKDKKTIVVDIPTDKHRKLIGREGSVRKEIERTFNVTVDIPRQRQEGETPTGVKIIGAADDVEKAKEHVLKLTKDADATDVSVPKYLHHSIADGGALARTFRNRHNVDIGFTGELPPKPKGQHGRKRATDGALPLITDEPGESSVSHSWEVEESLEDDGSEVTWNLRGATEDIAKAAAELNKLIKDESGKSTTGYLFLPDPSKYRFVVGPGGSQVNAIRKETGCKITIPKEQSDEAIVIKGSKEGVEQAKDIIVGLVQGGGSGGGRNGGGRKGGRANGD